MKQEVARRHQKDAIKWALDDIVYHTEVTHHDKVDSVKSPPTEGCYLHGLFLEGAGWSKDQTALMESEPKTLFVPLPILLTSAYLKPDEVKSRKDAYGSQGPYDCPCYKYRSRTDRCVRLAPVWKQFYTLLLLIIACVFPIIGAGLWSNRIVVSVSSFPFPLALTWFYMNAF